MNDIQQILETLEWELQIFEHHKIVPLSCDKWLASSALQKATRRGLLNLALRAGSRLWQEDRVSFWRRVHVMACEDIGVASPDVVVKVLTAFSNSGWRARNNDLKVGLYLIALMCGADKTRVADELLAIAGNSLNLKQRRAELFFSEDESLAKVVLDTKELLPERALALWLLAGTDILPHDMMPSRKGSPQLAQELIVQLCGYSLLAKASIAVMRKTQWPLGLFTPLVYQAIVQTSKGEQRKIVQDVWAKDMNVKGIPLVALDSYTRVGKAVIRELQSKNSELKVFSTKQIGIGMFYSEGERIDKRLSSSELDSIRQQAAFADFEAANGDIPSFIGLCSILSERGSLIASIRKNKMNDYFRNQNDEFSFSDGE